MTARKLVYWLMVLSPATLLGGIAMSTRATPASFRLEETPVVQCDRLRAYAGPVRSVSELRRTMGDQVVPGLVEDAARFWQLEQRAGRLLQLYPDSSLDNSAEGVRGEVFLAKEHLIGYLEESARARAGEGDFERAAQNIALGLELSELLKYADLRAVVITTNRQRRLALLASELQPVFTEHQCQLIASQLAELKRSQRSLSPLVAMVAKSMSAEVPGKDPISADYDLLLDLVGALRSETVASAVQIIAGQIGRCKTNDGATRVYQVRDAYHHQGLMLTALDEALTAYEPKTRGFLARL